MHHIIQQHTPPGHTAQTWASITTAEPRLRALAPIASAGGDWHSWEAIKSSFACLVGWNAQLPALRSTAAYDAGYAHLLRLFEQRKRARRRSRCT